MIANERKRAWNFPTGNSDQIWHIPALLLPDVPPDENV